MRGRLAPILTTAAPAAAAIGVFGTVFGAAARAEIGSGLTIAASVLVFSGAAQFAMVGLLASGAAAGSVLVAVGVLGLRHLVLGAVIRPHLAGGPRRRSAVAWFLIDETVGLALTRRDAATRVLVVSGITCYVAWVAGTVAGVALGAVVALEDLARAVFPVLFVGLAATIARTRGDLARAAIAAAATLAVVAVAPGLGGLAPLALAAAVSLAGLRA